MISYSEREMFPAPVVRLFRQATALIERLEVTEPPLVRCHELARAVAKVLNHGVGEPSLVVVDGKYGIVEHSWIEIRTGLMGKVRRFVLDVYAPGQLPQVQLLDISPLLPHADPLHTYKPSNVRRGDIDEALVERLVAALGPVFDRSGLLRRDVL